MSNEKSIHIREAQEEDMEAVAGLIRELAVYEKAADEALLDAEQLIQDGFSDKPMFKCLIAEEQGNILGMALYYPRYSTWKGKTLYLEDLLVTEKARRRGIGKAMFGALKEIAAKGGYKRLEWQVLDWNSMAIAFYEKEECTLDETWINGRITFP